MRFLYCGDVMGRSGRTVILENIPMLRDRYALDFVIVNGENAAHGFGITRKICDAFYTVGVDAITLGNHSWDQREVMTFIDDEARLIRPLNYPEGTPGRGVATYHLEDGRKIAVAQTLGRLFMAEVGDPFAAIDPVANSLKLGEDVQAFVVDIHAEATSEKMAMGHFLDGRATLVAGTHSHIPTADAQVLTGGTAYQSDLGMCGDYDSVIGMEKEVPIKRFTKPDEKGRLSPAKGEATLCATMVISDDETGKALEIYPIRLGGRLKTEMPDI